MNGTLSYIRTIKVIVQEILVIVYYSIVIVVVVVHISSKLVE